MLVRVQHCQRSVLVKERQQKPKQTKLLPYLQSQPQIAQMKIKIGARSGQRERVAHLGLRIASVNIMAPVRLKQPDATLPLVAVLASEIKTRRKSPLQWLLLASDETADAETARRLVQRYRARWSIEEFFRVLKSGMRIEDRRLDHVEDLRKCLAFDAITAWRVCDLSRAARATPEAAASDFLSDLEIKVLYIKLYARGMVKIRPPPASLNISTAVVDIARYAGFIPSKRQPYPGMEKMWKGMKYLLHSVAYHMELMDSGLIRDV